MDGLSKGHKLFLMHVHLVPDVQSSGFEIDISDGADKFSGTPEVSAAVSQAEIWFRSEEQITRAAFEVHERAARAHVERKSHDHVDVVRHDEDFKDLDFMPCCDFSQQCFAQLLVLFLPEHVEPVLRAPLEVVHALRDGMAAAGQVFAHFISLQESFRYIGFVTDWRAITLPPIF